MDRKSFKEKIRKDFKPAALEDRPVEGVRTKAVPGARLIPLSEIHPDPEQPRKTFGRVKFEELLESVKSKGVIEPLSVKRDEKGYKIIIGERRFNAAKKAGLAEVPCIIKDIGEAEVLEYQLIENLQRESLKPVEEAEAFKRLSDKGHTQLEIAGLVGKSQPYISQSLKILSLPKEILDKALKENIPKEVLLKMLEKPKKPERGRPKVKPWTWKPEGKEFTVQIKFKKKDYGRDDIIRSLEQLLQNLRGNRK